MSNINKVAKLSVLALLWVLIVSTGCGRKDFRLNFMLGQGESGNWRVVYYASDKRGGFLQESVAVVSDGKGSLDCPTINPTLVRLYVSGPTSFVIYAEKGDEINIAGSSASPYNWTVGGNDINEELTAWRNENAEILSMGVHESVNEAVSKYVEAHPESEINGLLLLSDYDRNLDPSEFNRLWAKVPPGERKRWVSLTGRSDIITGHAKNPATLRSMALRSLENGMDTLKTSRVKATLLFFWNAGLDNRKEKFDSLKTLSREYSDSSRRIIADICLEPDSVSWKLPLRSDSVSGFIRGWMPAGLADTVLMALGVNRTPFYLVVDPEGHRQYGGLDSKSAFDTFRRVAGPDKKQ